MNFFIKRTKNNPINTQPQGTPTTAEAESVNDVHASSPSAEVVFGGLGWYRTQFRRAMKLALALAVALIVSVSVNALLFLNQPGPRYFAATPDLRIAPLIVPLWEG